MRAQKKGGKCMETFAADGGVQPQLQPQPAEANASRSRPLQTETFPEPPLSLGWSGQAPSQRYFVPRSPKTLRLHPALARLNLLHSLTDSHQNVRLKKRCLSEPICITTNGTIIAGFREWHEALHEGRTVVDCIVYSLGDDQALEVILSHYQTQRPWNAFTRIRLALELEPYFQAKAVANQRHDGKYKGSANLPKAACIDVIARLAGVGSRNVDHAKTILCKAHPGVIDALHYRTLSIHRAVKLCDLARSQQMEQLIRTHVEGATGKVTRRAIAQLRMQGSGLGAAAVLKKLQEQETREPGSIVVRAGRCHRTLILLGQDLLAGQQPQAEVPPA